MSIVKQGKPGQSSVSVDNIHKSAGSYSPGLFQLTQILQQVLTTVLLLQQLQENQHTSANLRRQLSVNYRNRREAFLLACCSSYKRTGTTEEKHSCQPTAAVTRELGQQKRTSPANQLQLQQDCDNRREAFLLTYRSSYKRTETKEEKHSCQPAAAVTRELEKTEEKHSC